MPWPVGSSTAALAALAWIAICVILDDDEARAPEPSGGAPAPKRATWTLLGDPLTLRPGTRYRGCVSVPWPFSPSPSTVREKAEGEGFRDVKVWTSPPAGWPVVECKHYVEATWGRPEKKLDVPGVVKLAWEERLG